uniref:BRO-D n=1 Tax=Lymantria dispar multicapsid nuclear polyhedrosis virus TaxID=10449 RepID=A0A140HQU5_NPVLD|nr:BRO-D [Lymantria dispar multiple nucleopolyhedrovirus]
MTMTQFAVNALLAKDNIFRRYNTPPAAHCAPVSRVDRLCAQHNRQFCSEQFLKWHFNGSNLILPRTMTAWCLL